MPVHTIVLDASSINQLDASAIDMLILVAKGFKDRNVSMLCANWKGPQRDLLELSGFYDVIPPANLFLGLHDAVVEARKRCVHFVFRVSMECVICHRTVRQPV